jgi:RecA-family ATPase
VTDVFERVITATDLKTQDKFSEENSWLVEGIVPVGQAGLVVAPSKSFKSSVTLNMAISIVQGKEFAGLKTKKGNVLIIANEDTPFVLHQRLNGYDDEMDGLNFLTGGIFKLDRADHMNSLYAYILQNDIKLVIFDNLKDMLSSPDTLNDMTRMNDVLHNITKLKLIFEDVTFMLIAHARKSVADESLDNKEFRVRSTHALGSSALGAWFEFCLDLSPKLGKHSRYSILNVEARNFAFDKELYFGYVADKFLMLDPSKDKKEKEPDSELVEEVKKETPEETTKEEATAFMEILKDSGKVEEIDN